MDLLRKPLKKLSCLLLCGSYSVVIYLLSNYMVTNGYILPEGMLQLIHYQDNLSMPLEKIMLVKPFLSYWLGWLIYVIHPQDAWHLLNAAIGFVFVAIYLYILEKNCMSVQQKFLLLIANLLSAALLFIFLTSPARSLSILLLAIAIYAMISYADTGKVLFLMLAGSMVGLAPLANPEILGFCLSTSLLIPLYTQGSWEKFKSIYIVYFTPLLLLTAAWLYLHWIFADSTPFFPEIPKLHIASFFPFSTVGAILIWLYILIRLPFYRKITVPIALVLFVAGFSVDRFDFSGQLLLIGISSLFATVVFSVHKEKMKQSLRISMIFLFLLQSGLTWMDVVYTSGALSVWRQALSGQEVATQLYREDFEVARALHSLVPEKSIIATPVRGVERIRFLSKGRYNFVQDSLLVNDTAVGVNREFMLLPEYFEVDGNYVVIYRNNKWLIVRKSTP